MVNERETFLFRLFTRKQTFTLIMQHFAQSNYNGNLIIQTVYY